MPARTQTGFSGQFYRGPVQPRHICTGRVVVHDGARPNIFSGGAKAEYDPEHTFIDIALSFPR
ncbi:hypothetical protein J6590_072531 [Homalodisca vitripennis]|nr:hypothetical protein J6590_072531 [Homalodisca vitripennis]